MFHIAKLIDQSEATFVTHTSLSSMYIVALELGIFLHSPMISIFSPIRFTFGIG
jgi:hypothetical protein